MLLLAMIMALFSVAQAGKKINADSVLIRNSIMSFYNWYLKNDSKLNSFELYQSLKEKFSPPYKINWKEAEKYFAFIRSSVPQLGETFIKNQRAFLKQCDSAFKVDLEDDIPYGFDHDWYTQSQEDPKWLVDELKKSKQWVMTIKGTDASVDVLGYYTDNGKKTETVVMCFEMKNEKGKWKIAKIGCPYKSSEPDQ